MGIANISARRGSVFILALAVMVVLTGMALVFARSVRVEAMIDANRVAAMKADAVAQGAEAYVRAVLADATAGELPADDTLERQTVAVGDGWFWLLKPATDEQSGYQFGLIDEAGLLNLNTADEGMLMMLPGMNADLAAAVVDWRDTDDEALPGGAETSQYLLLENPHTAKNDAFETVGELGMVQGFTPELVNGEDRNGNGLLDTAEDADEDGQLDRGIASLVTVYGVEPNTNAEGQPRMNVNTAGPGQIMNTLGTSLSGDRLSTVAARTISERPFSNLIDYYYKTQLTVEEFRGLEERVTTVNGETRRGLVNVNSAPREVLMALPGMEETDAETIVSRRQEGSWTWPDLASFIDVLPQEKAVTIGRFITVKSYFCTADIVAVDGSGRSFKRRRVTYDLRSSPPAVVLVRDLTGLGWPLDPEIRRALRSGEGLEP